MSTIIAAARRITKPRHTADHRAALRGEQVRAQETFNTQIRGYGNNNSHRSHPSWFGN